MYCFEGLRALKKVQKMLAPHCTLCIPVICRKFIKVLIILVATLLVRFVCFHFPSRSMLSDLMLLICLIGICLQIYLKKEDEHEFCFDCKIFGNLMSDQLTYKSRYCLI